MYWKVPNRKLSSQKMTLFRYENGPMLQNSRFMLIFTLYLYALFAAPFYLEKKPSLLIYYTY